jgi:hypothetical protein
MATKRSLARAPRELDALAGAVHSAVRDVLADAARADWSAASRRVLALVHAARRLETEVDFHYMSEWLERAKKASVSAPSRVAAPRRQHRRASRAA